MGSVLLAVGDHSHINAIVTALAQLAWGGVGGESANNENGRCWATRFALVRHREPVGRWLRLWAVFSST